jgi:predicted amino acid dehydrogenase
MARFLPDVAIEWITARKSPVVASHVTGITSAAGATTEGWLIGCPLTPQQMTEKLPLDVVYERIIQCTRLAAEQGAEIIGLGAFTSVVGDGGITIAKSSPIAVTTGNSYTIATAIDGVLRACELLNIDVPEGTLAVVGATGSIGRTCAMVLSRTFKNVILVGRDLERTQAVASLMPNAEATIDLTRISEADAIVTVSSAGKELIMPEHLKPGAVVCDVARPRDVSKRVAEERPDVLVIEGGVIKIPGDVNFNFNFGFPPKTAYACMCETIMLALEGRIENFTLGKDVSVEQVDEINRIAKKHGFQLAKFRAFEREVEMDVIERARKARITGPAIPRASTRA